MEINNLTTSSIDEEFLKKIAKIVLKEENKKGLELSVALIGPKRMRELNRKYRGKNRVTDVLVFPTGKGFLEKIEGLGEIVICPRELKKNAKRFGLRFEKELARVLIHGILHLLGYEDEKSEAAAKKMREKEEYYLSLIKS